MFYHHAFFDTQNKHKISEVAGDVAWQKNMYSLKKIMSKA